MKKKFNVMYMYVDPETDGLFGVSEADERLEPASISDLRSEIAEQKREIEVGEADYDEIVPWEGILKVSEGYYTWDILSGDYRKLNNKEVAEHLKEVKSTFADKVHRAVFNRLKAEDVEFDGVAMATRWTKDSPEKPVIVIHLVVDGEIHEFTFLQEDIEAKQIFNFAQFFVDLVKRRFS